MPSTLGKVKVMGDRGPGVQGRCPPPGVQACPGAWQRRVSRRGGDHREVVNRRCK